LTDLFLALSEASENEAMKRTHKIKIKFRNTTNFNRNVEQLCRRRVTL